MIHAPPDVDAAAGAWGANCGPCSLAALLGRTVADVRGLFAGFERRGYANPTQMKAALTAAGVRFIAIGPRRPEHGLLLVQFRGPWDERSIREQYRHTHWIATAGVAVYDVNVGYWVSREAWEDRLEHLVDARWRPLRRLPAGSEEAKKDSTAFNSADGGADMIGLVNTRCSRCGCLVTDHDVDDEERRGCQKCECDQFEAPPDPVLGGEPGTPEWWRSPGYMIHGPADTILRLLEQEEVSRRKALELLAYLHCGAPQDLRHALPPAPWDKLNWCDDPPAGAGLPVREACRRRVPLDGADAQALEHALTITERERDSIRAVVEAVDAVLQGAGVHHASRAEAVRRIVDERTRARSLLAEVALRDSGALQGTAAHTLLDRVREALEPT